MLKLFTSLFTFIVQVLVQTKNLLKEVITISIVVAGVCILLDLLLKTNTGVLSRTLSMLADVGIKGDILLVIVVLLGFVVYTKKFNK